MGTRHLVTAEELERMPSTGPIEYTYELVRGKLVRLSLARREHAVLVAFLTVELGRFVQERKLGKVFGDGTGYKLFADPDTVRGPDVSFISRERYQTVRSAPSFMPIAPDLAVEVVSPDNTRAELARKSQDYFEAGTRMVWIVNPRTRRVIVRRPDQPDGVLTPRDTLTANETLPGFALALDRLFAELD